jgi:hypothetical protein
MWVQYNNDVSRRGFLVLAAVWAALLLASLAVRLPGLARSLPSVLSPAGERAAVESADPGYHAFLVRVRAAVPLGRAAMVFIDGSAGEEEFASYRAAYELYPVPVRVTFRRGPQPGRHVELGAADAKWASGRRPAVLAACSRSDPESGKIWKITRIRGSRVGIAPAPESPVSPLRYARIGRWMAGVWLILFLGWSFVNATRIAPAVRGIAAGVALAWVAGAGLLGWLLTAAGAAGLPWMGALTGIGAATLAIVMWRPAGPTDGRPAAVGGWDRAGVALVAVAFALAVAGALAPQSAWSNWDAWAVWDLKVKAALAEGRLPFAFLRDPGYGFTHPEYPLGWPAVQAFFAQCAGGFDTRLLRLMSPLFALCVPALLATLLLELGVTKGRWLIAGLVALLPAALTQSANGYLDWPLAATTTAALLLLVRACRGDAPAWTAACLAGLAGNLKNEAALFGLGVLLALFIATIAGRVSRRALVAAIAVWVLLVAPWRTVAFALDLAPRDFAFGLGTALAAAPGRIFLFVQALALETLGPGLGGASFASGAPVPWSEWPSHLLNSWLVFWFVAGYVLFRGRRRLLRPGVRELAIVLAVQVCAAALAYVLTIRDPRWLLASSLDRLLLQWVPAVVALCAALVLG